MTVLLPITGSDRISAKGRAVQRTFMAVHGWGVVPQSRIPERRLTIVVLSNLAEFRPGEMVDKILKSYPRLLILRSD
jgi:hypothetical protein